MHNKLVALCFPDIAVVYVSSHLTRGTFQVCFQDIKYIPSIWRYSIQSWEQHIVIL